MNDDVMLDIRVHQTVFGWEPSLRPEPIPRYSTDKADAELVRIWLLAHGWSIEEVRSDIGVSVVLVKMRLDAPAETVEGVGKTSQEALCRAALKAAAQL